MATPTTLPPSLWFFDPVQGVIILIGAFNAGASYIASPLTVPMLELPSVPAQHTSAQMTRFLHGAEYIFPPLNGIQTLANVVLAVLAYRASDSSDLAATKLPKLVLAAACNFGTTAVALGYMAGINEKLKGCAREMEKGGRAKSDPTVVEKRFGELLAQWKRGNNTRAVLMVGAAAAGMWALLSKA